MFLKVFYYVTLVFLIASSQASFSKSCEGGFSEPETGLESYRQLLVRLTQESLGIEKLSFEQVKVLETYHQVVRGEKGTDRTFARAGNYTVSQVRRIVEFLYEVFTPQQIEALIESGVVEINRSSDSKVTGTMFSRVNEVVRPFFTEKFKDLIEYGVIEINRFSASRVTTMRILRRIKAGKKVFIQHQGTIFRINKILEEMESGFLIEVEKIDERFGRGVVKGKMFLQADHISASSIEKASANINKILERTDRGLLIGILETEQGIFGIEKKERSIAFLSFEKAIENELLPDNPTAKDYRELEETLNTYMSDNFSQIRDSRNIPYWRADETRVDGIRMDYGFIDSLHRSLIRSIDTFRLVNSESETIFIAARSDRKRVDSRDLNPPSPTNTEKQLSEQGYKKSYTGGVDRINEWVVVRRRLEELQANPRTTHIEYFADQIPHHIAYIREGIKNHYSSFTLKQQLKLLESLEKEAEEAIVNKRVTYQWWLGFNSGLARVVAGKSYIGIPYETQVHIIQSISEFPLKIVIPTIAGDLGIMTFNRAGLEGVYPSVLINQPSLAADGATLPADLFFRHDFLHANSFKGNRIYLEYSTGHRLFHRRLWQNIENLPYEKRKRAEVVYFIITHENSAKQNISYSDKTPRQIRALATKLVREDVANLFNFPNNPIRKELKIKSFVDVFMEVYNQTLQHQ